MPESISQSHRFEVKPRPFHLGGGWRLQCFQGDVEVAGGVFPLDADLDHEDAVNEAHSEAMYEGEAWLAASRNGPGECAVRIGPEDV